MPKKYKINVLDTLSLTSSVGVNKSKRLSIVDGWFIQESAVVSAKIKVITETLTFTDGVAQPSYSAGASDQVSLNESIFILKTIPITLNDNLILSDSIGTNLHNRSVTDNLSLSEQIIHVVPTLISVSESLTDCLLTLDEALLTIEEIIALCSQRGLRDSVSIRRSITNISITDYLQLQQAAAKVLVINVADLLSLSDGAQTLAFYDNVVDNLSLTESVLFTKSKFISEQLSLTEDVNDDLIFNRSLSDILSFTDKVIIPYFEPPALVFIRQVLLTYPYGSPTHVVSLRSPEFNNVEQFEFRRINRRNRGGGLIIHRQEYWPISERLIMSFKSLRHETVDELLEFFDISLGKEIGLLDHENRQWKGIILTPFSRVKDVTGRDCDFAAELEFEGVVV